MKFHFQKKKKNSDFQICGSRGESQYGGFRQKGTLVAQDIWNQMVEMWELFFIFTSHQVQYLTRKCQMQFRNV